MPKCYLVIARKIKKSLACARTSRRSFRSAYSKRRPSRLASKGLSLTPSRRAAQRLNVGAGVPLAIPEFYQADEKSHTVTQMECSENKRQEENMTPAALARRPG